MTDVLPGGYIVTVAGLPEVRRLLAQFEGQELQNKMRVAVRAGLRPFQASLRVEAAGAGHPRSFTKVPAGTVTTHGGASGREIEGYVRPKSPLFNIFEPGAGSHEISPNRSVTARPGRKGGKPRKPILAGPAGGASWTAEGRKRPAAFFSTSAVTHPGMAARPIMPRAFAAAQEASTDAMAKAIFAMTGGTGR